MSVAPEPRLLAGFALSTGVIPLESPFERVPPFLRVVTPTGDAPDSMDHELALAFRVKGKGLVVLTACAHRGVINSVRHAMALSGETETGPPLQRAGPPARGGDVEPERPRPPGSRCGRTPGAREHGPWRVAPSHPPHLGLAVMQGQLDPPRLHGRRRGGYAPGLNTLHVVLGAGQIGTLLVERLRARGLPVRQVRRSPGGAAAPGVELRSGSVADPAFAREAMAGAAVVYHCVNPAYDRWGVELLPNTHGILGGAARSGARLVVLDNLYMYNQADQHAMDESTPVAPSSKKGQLRAEAAALLLDAHARGEAKVVVARASDFYGPGVVNAHFGDRFWGRVLAGKPGECLGDPETPHAFTYAPDVARGLERLGEADDADFGRVWMLPTAEPVSPAERARRIGAALGVEARTTRIPGLVLTVAGWFVPAMRELAEMCYQWESPYRVVDRAFRARFGVDPTPIDEGAAATARWVDAHYRRAGR